MFFPSLLGVTNGAMSVNALARCIMVEASIGSAAEQIAIVVGKGIMDCSGRLKSACNSTKNYKPSWTTASKQVVIPGVCDCYFKFFSSSDFLLFCSYL